MPHVDSSVPVQDPKVFQERRKKLMDKVGPDSIVIIEGAKPAIRNFDNEYLPRQDSNFYYLTGIDELEVTAVLIPEEKDYQYILFSRPKDWDYQNYLKKRRIYILT